MAGTIDEYRFLQSTGKELNIMKELSIIIIVMI